MGARGAFCVARLVVRAWELRRLAELATRVTSTEVSAVRLRLTLWPLSSVTVNVTVWVPGSHREIRLEDPGLTSQVDRNSSLGARAWRGCENLCEPGTDPARRTMRRRPDPTRAIDRLLLLPTSLALLLACAEPPPAAEPMPPAAAASAAPAEDAPEAPGEGFVVWESNRSGAWRLWLRDLDGSPPRQLSPEEGDRQHCCPHIAPGGERVAYLSLPRGAATYPEGGASGPLHLIAIDGSGDRIAYPQARTYFEHRAVVWRSADELILIDAEGRTQLLDVAAGTAQALSDAPVETHGWLVNSSLTHATMGRPSFSTYDAERRRIDAGRVLGGCQPYFSHDGRWGFWVAGAGGPIRTIDLASRRLGEILKKSDPRLPQDRAYLYFPMLSHDAMLFAWGASPDQHNHATSDYDIFVAPTDPRTLQLTGAPWRVTADPATDRFPDVFSAPLPLGRHSGEAPLRVALTAPDGDPTWRWSLAGAEADAVGAAIEPLFDRPGSYLVRAQRGDRELLGWVRVRPAQPPGVVGTVLRDRRTVIVHFDEEVDADAATAVFDSGLPVAGLAPADAQRSLVLTLGRDLDDVETLLLGGIRDLAQKANEMPATRLEIAPPAWPSDPRGLVFLWRTDDAFNEVDNPVTGERRACRLTPDGRAWLDRNFAMELAGGSFVAEKDTMLGVLRGCRRTNEMTLEATLTPHRRVAGSSPARIVTFSNGNRSRNLTLGQVGERLIFRLRTGTTGRNADRPQLDLGQVAIGRPTHLVVSYKPGHLRAYLDGRQVLDTDTVQDGFFHWQKRPLLFGKEWRAQHAWHGSLEGVAIYDRVLDPEEVAKNHRLYAEERAQRPEVSRLRLRARLERRSPTPSLEAIAPYREALAVFEYRVEDVLAGTAAQGETPASGTTIRVAHRVLVDGETLPIGERQVAAAYELTLESFFDHRQLESLYLSDSLPERAGALYFSAEVE